MMMSCPSTVRVIRRLKSATTAIRISSATAMPKILRPIEKRIAPPPPRGKASAKQTGRPKQIVVDYTLKRKRTMG